MKNRILIVVDYQSDGEMISELLKEKFEISLLTNPSKFLNIVFQVKPNLIILDSLFNSQDLCNMLSKENTYSDIPVIILSSLPALSFDEILYPDRVIIIDFFDINLVRDKILEITN